jgi:hypothetical protein
MPSATPLPNTFNLKTNKLKLADIISQHLQRFINSSSSDMIIPNYYIGRYEMDVFKLNATGYITEYEIKISKTDYLNDFKKGDKNNLKHTEIKKGFRSNRFFFVVPYNLFDVSEVPDYCGLIYYHPDQKMEIVKTAKLLHKNKFTDFKGLATKLYHRELHRRSEIRILKNNIKPDKTITKAKVRKKRRKVRKRK